MEYVNALVVLGVGFCLALLVYSILSKRNEGGVDYVKTEETPVANNADNEDGLTVRNGFRFGFGFGIGFGIAGIILGVVTFSIGVGVVSLVVEQIADAFMSAF